MVQSEPSETPSGSAATESPTWTYPTRFCRICREDVPATVTMYPPGIPMQFQTPIVEYKNEDEYGRLIKPCMCRGSSRYIHELCLLRSRTENNRAGSMWKCHECGHKFNFQRLKIQRYLSSNLAAGILTIVFMVYLMFILGFVADPIINFYMDPYESLMGYESVWDELELRSARESHFSRWTQHFAKGFISMGLVGFLKTLLLNPFQWIHLRWGGGLSSRASTGRDRAVNISWIALVIGMCSAFVFFYKWVQVVMQRFLVRIGNNIVDTKLPGDDDDLKAPPGWKQNTASTAGSTPAPESHATTKDTHDPATEPATADEPEPKDIPLPASSVIKPRETISGESTRASTPRDNPTPVMSGSWVSVDEPSIDRDENGLLSGVQRQGWSFANL